VYSRNRLSLHACASASATAAFRGFVSGRGLRHLSSVKGLVVQDERSDSYSTSLQRRATMAFCSKHSLQCDAADECAYE
jgi:hypothetical protein